MTNPFASPTPSRTDPQDSDGSKFNPFLDPSAQHERGSFSAPPGSRNKSSSPTSSAHVGSTPTPARGRPDTSQTSPRLRSSSRREAVPPASPRNPFDVPSSESSSGTRSRPDLPTSSRGSDSSSSSGTRSRPDLPTSSRSDYSSSSSGTRSRPDLPTAGTRSRPDLPIGGSSSKSKSDVTPPASPRVTNPFDTSFSSAAPSITRSTSSATLPITKTTEASPTSTRSQSQSQTTRRPSTSSLQSSSLFSTAPTPAPTTSTARSGRTSGSSTQRQPSASPSGRAPASPTLSVEHSRERSTSPSYTGGFTSGKVFDGSSRGSSPSTTTARPDTLYASLYSPRVAHAPSQETIRAPPTTTTSSKYEVPMDEVQLLQKKIEELETANSELTKEKTAMLLNVTELQTNVGIWEAKCKQMATQIRTLEESTKNLEFEKSMMVEQINGAFKEVTRLNVELEEARLNKPEIPADPSLEPTEVTPEALEARSLTIEALQRDKKELKQSVKLLEAKLSLLQDQNLHFDKLLVKDQEKIRELEHEKGATNDAYETAILRQSDLADQVWSLEKKLKEQQDKFAALTKPNPKLAIAKLEKEADSLFVYGCRSLKDKQMLLKEALTTVNPDVIITVVSYLHFTLSPELFDAVVMAKDEACAYYLNYLKKSQSPLFKQVCLRNGKLKDLGQYMLENALALTDPQKKVEQLKKCFDFCAKHPQETKQFSRVVEDSLNYALIEVNLSSV
eukprot:TRINITY_DN3963_c0_g1_i1.p1 TRINITY_DN3963_c0_g1~~TRINITY_DN3963_c0_g1_i1.p1  ORF type:complete len:731 (-),score=142.74 TRINITY_DN3963_c0_g1_i1:46-2238(-)